MLEVGSVVDNKLRIEQLLGKGGMGIVAIATHLQLDQLVAVKVLHDELATDPTVIGRFLREAKASAQLKSEHVCRVSDVGQLSSGAPYIVMELLEGEDLSHLIEHNSLPVEVACDYVLQACVAIAEAHALGIVHRDLKPGNLFVTHRLDGSVLIKVLDFGIAKTAASADFKMTSTQMVMGSPGYMSPEQLRSAKDVDARSDLWSLGVILYEAVSGRLPFAANTITELAVKVAVDPPDALINVDPRFSAVVMRCLEKSLDRRYQNVSELAADLASIAGPQHAPTASLVTRLLTAQKGVVGSAMMQKASASYSSGVAPTMQTSSAALPPAPVLPAGLGTPPQNIQVIVAPPQTTLQGAIEAATAAQPKRNRLGLIVVVVLTGAAAAVAFMLVSHHDDKKPDQVALVPHLGSAERGDLKGGLPGPPPSEDASVISGKGAIDAAIDPTIVGTLVDAREVATATIDAGQVASVTFDAGPPTSGRPQGTTPDAGASLAQAPLDARAATADAHVAPADAHVATPATPGEELHSAESAYRGGKYAAALSEAEQALKAGIGNPRAAHMLAAKAACQLGQQDTARRHARVLAEQGREQVEEVCDAHGIDLQLHPRRRSRE